MFEPIYLYSATTKPQILEHEKLPKTDLNGLNKIVAIGYDQNKSQRLPVSRYSLKINVLGLGTREAT